jgi:hypothetical protein
VTSSAPHSVFFGYPSHPESLREAMANGARRIAALPDVLPVTWEDLHMAGQVVVDEILDAIDASTLVALEVTHLNPNVMFELGYSVGSNRRVWLLRDGSDDEATRRWVQFGLLSSIHYSGYTNSLEVYEAFLKDQPLEQTLTLLERSIRDLLKPTETPSVFYVPSAYQTEVGRELTERILAERKMGLRCVVDDQTEASARSLAWYGQSVLDAAAVVVHIVEARRKDADLFNARSAFVAGLGLGMGKPTILVAEDDQLAPVDYRDLVIRRHTSKEAVAALDSWLSRTLATTYASLRRRSDGSSSLRLATELRDLRLGDPVAENEEDSLGTYFLQTSAFREVMAERATVFVGRKGSGKTANLLQAAERLRSDVRNLVCVIKPIWYEWESLLRLLKEYERRDAKGYVVQSLWKLLVYSEVASQAAEEIARRPATVRSQEEQQFLDFIDGPGSFVKDEFAVRLERAVGVLLSKSAPEGVGDQRVAISEALHDSTIRELREHLGRILTKRKRVAILVDNLDKGWEADRDLHPLAVFLLGLLTTVSRLAADFSRSDHWREPVNVSLAVFLRSDIFSQVLRVAVEPDKVPVSRLSWARDEMLARVVEERFVAARAGKAEAPELWSEYFAPTVRGLPARDYILSRVLPRPRDIIFWCGAAISGAINRGHSRVEEADVLAGEEEYSKFAFDAVQVEDLGARIPLRDAMYGLVGEISHPTEERVRADFGPMELSEADLSELVQRLVGLGVFGLETHPGQFDYPEDEDERRRDLALTDRLVETSGCGRRFEIHPAYRAFLGIDETPP